MLRKTSRAARTSIRPEGAFAIVSNSEDGASSFHTTVQSTSLRCPRFLQLDAGTVLEQKLALRPRCLIRVVGCTACLVVKRTDCSTKLHTNDGLVASEALKIKAKGDSSPQTKIPSSMCCRDSPFGPTLSDSAFGSGEFARSELTRDRRSC